MLAPTCGHERGSPSHNNSALSSHATSSHAGPIDVPVFVLVRWHRLPTSTLKVAQHHSSRHIRLVAHRHGGLSQAGPPCTCEHQSAHAGERCVGTCSFLHGHRLQLMFAPHDQAHTGCIKLKLQHLEGGAVCSVRCPLCFVPLLIAFFKLTAASITLP
jgi:hypothetical protein